MLKGLLIFQFDKYQILCFKIKKSQNVELKLKKILFHSIKNVLKGTKMLKFFMKLARTYCELVFQETTRRGHFRVPVFKGPLG